MTDKSAKEELAKLTGRPVEDFDSSDYRIPDFAEQDLQPKADDAKGGETRGL